eukprot:TRINITY_DN15793_c0_g1_i1.p1 TRINITY_DN15793_c0_g1~~TRINITY_DN15793_c0_g1_i1.p1  ORF type:complete len:969 (+),score=317.94 TRINITY_DN15793_c0_g1_i1:50-2908(+)
MAAPPPMGAGRKGRRELPMVPFLKRLMRPCGGIPATGVGAGEDTDYGEARDLAWCAEVTGVVAGEDTSVRVDYFPSEITMMQHMLEDEVGVPDVPVWQVHNPLLLQLWREGLWSHPPARKCHLLATSQATEPITYAATVSHLLSPPEPRPTSAPKTPKTPKDVTTPRAVPQRILGLWVSTCWTEAWGWVVHGFPPGVPVAAFTTPEAAMEHTDIPAGTSGAFARCLVFVWVLADTGMMLPETEEKEDAGIKGATPYNVKVDGKYPRQSVRERNKARVAALKDKSQEPPPHPHRAWVTLGGQGLLLFHPNVDAVVQYVVEVAPGKAPRGASGVSALTEDHAPGAFEEPEPELEDESAEAARAALREAERLAEISQWVVRHENELSRARAAPDPDTFFADIEAQQRRTVFQDEWYVRQYLTLRHTTALLAIEESKARAGVVTECAVASRHVHQEHLFMLANIADRAALEADEAHRAKLLFELMVPSIIKRAPWEAKHAALGKISKILKKIIRKRMSSEHPQEDDGDDYSSDVARWCVCCIQQLLVSLPDDACITRSEGGELACMMLSAVELFGNYSDDVFFDGLDAFYLVAPQRIMHKGGAAGRDGASLLATSLAIAVPDTRTVTSWYSTLAGLVSDLGCLFEALKITQTMEAAAPEEEIVDYEKFDELPPEFDDNSASFARVVRMAEAVLKADECGAVGAEAQALLKALNPDVTERVACHVLRAVAVVNNIGLLKRVPDRADELDPEDKAKEGSKIFRDFVHDVINIMQACGNSVAVLTHGFQVLAQMLAHQPALVTHHPLQTMCFVTCHRLAHVSQAEAGDIDKLIGGLLGCLNVMATGSTLLKESMREHNIVELIDTALHCFPHDGAIVDRSLGILTLFSTSLNLRMAMLQGGIAHALEHAVSHGAAARHPPLAAKAHQLLDVLAACTQSSSFRSVGSFKRSMREMKPAAT